MSQPLPDQVWDDPDSAKAMITLLLKELKENKRQVHRLSPHAHLVAENADAVDRLSGENHELRQQITAIETENTALKSQLLGVPTDHGESKPALGLISSVSLLMLG